jgi:hypothetical protein
MDFEQPTDQQEPTDQEEPFATLNRAIQHAYLTVKQERQLRDQIDQLEQAGTTTASAYWRDDKYLVLVHPMDNGHRRREYIGNDPDRVAEALAKIERHRQAEDVRRQLHDLHTRKYWFNHYVGELRRQLPAVGA